MIPTVAARLSPAAPGVEVQPGGETRPAATTRVEARGHRPHVSRHADGSLRWVECECGTWAGFPANPQASRADESGVWDAHAAHVRYATS